MLSEDMEVDYDPLQLIFRIRHREWSQFNDIIMHDIIFSPRTEKVQTIHWICINPQFYQSLLKCVREIKAGSLTVTHSTFTLGFHSV